MSVCQADALSDGDRIARLLRYGAAFFGIPTTFVLGGPYEQSLAVGDFNNDGTADLAVTEAEADQMWLIPGDGRGSFASPTRLTALRRQRIVAVGDFDGDGIDDQAVADQGATGMTVLFGDGTGSFSVTPDLSGSTRVIAVLLGDFDQDGAADLAMVDSTTHHVTIVLGDERGEVRAATRLPVGTGPSAIAAGDFNGDGHVDLVVANSHSDSVSILLGDRQGSFGAATHVVAGAEPMVVVVGDLNGDEITDLGVVHRSSQVSILAGNGRGHFSLSARVALETGRTSRADTASGSGTGGPGQAQSAPTSGDLLTQGNAETYQGVAALTLNPTTLAGGSGDSATGTITLNAPAPAGGVVVTLTSSNVELAATVPSITVPAGATTATFAVTTNARYRKYSGLAFSVTISATHAATQSATLTVTAQPPPADFSSGVPPGAQTQWQGLICGRIGPIGGNPEILYDCSPPTATAFGNCTFRQECNIGCRRVRPAGAVFNDFCMTAGPGPVAVHRNHIISGDRVPATLTSRFEDRTPGFIPNGLPGTISNQGMPGAINGVNVNASTFPHQAIFFPLDATSVDFDVATSYVPSTTFIDVVGDWVDDAVGFVAANGASGHAWIAMVPPEPPPSLPIPTLGDFQITGTNPVTGGQSSIGQIDVSGISSGGGPTITLTSSHPAIASLPASVNMPASTTLGQQVSITTQPPAVDTDVTLTATDGRYTFSAVLTVLAPPPPPVLQGVSVNPTSVVGGNPSTGTVTLSAPQSGATVVQVSIIDTAPATLPTNDPPCPPSSRCHHVTVPAGATSANFTITTSPVTGQFNLNIFANLAGSPERQALLLITPGAPPAGTLSALSLSPTTVVGGNASTGTVTLSAAAPSSGAVVTLSDNSAAATAPASVTVPAGATSATFTVTTSTVTTSTTVNISGTYGGTTHSATLTVNPPPTPAAPTLISPANSATVAQPVTFDWNDVANATSYEIQVDDSSTISTPFVASQTVSASQVTLSGLPARRLWWRVRAQNAAGVFGPFSATRRFTAEAAPVEATLSSVSVNPTSVVGSNASTGTATLTTAAPTGGAVVALSSSNPTVATVPASVTVASGTTRAIFTVTTSTVTTSTAVSISGTYSGSTHSATLTVTPPATNVTLTVTATGRSGERVMSNPAGINVLVGNTASASFATNTSITLNATHNRDVIWSGACSSGGNKTKTCTFTITGNASVTGNVQ